MLPKISIATTYYNRKPLFVKTLEVLERNEEKDFEVVVVDDGSDDASATLEVFSDHHIERGDLGYWYDSPRNIHRQLAEGEEPSCVVILMGGDGGRDGIFDVDRGIFRRS